MLRQVAYLFSSHGGAFCVITRPRIVVRDRLDRVIQWPETPGQDHLDRRVEPGDDKVEPLDP